MLCVLTFTSHVHKTHAAILNESGDCLAESSLYLEEKKKAHTAKDCCCLLRAHSIQYTRVHRYVHGAGAVPETTVSSLRDAELTTRAKITYAADGEAKVLCVRTTASDKAVYDPLGEEECRKAATVAHQRMTWRKTDAPIKDRTYILKFPAT